MSSPGGVASTCPAKSPARRDLGRGQSPGEASRTFFDVVLISAFMISREPWNQTRHVAHLVLSLSMGGTEGLVDQMLRHPPKGFRASAICLDEIGVIGAAARYTGIQVTLIPRGHGVNWRLPAAIARHARQHGIDVFHCHHYGPWFYGVLARLLFPRLRVIYTEHGRLYPDVPSTKRRVFNRFMRPLTDAITAVSPAVALALQRVEGFPLSKIKVVFNGVDGQRFSNLPARSEIRRRLGLRGDFVYFILCSRLDPIKWIDGLLEALRRVVARYPACGLVLVGDGPERQRIAGAIEQLAIGGHVVMPGYQTNIPEWLSASDTFVLSSLSEGTSVSLIESMAAGIPSVVTRVGGNEYVIEDGTTGSLVPSQDVERLSAEMLRFARDPILRDKFGRNARKRFEERFELHRMLESYATIYRSLVG